MERGRTRKVASSDRQREHGFLESSVDSKAYERFKRPAYYGQPTQKQHEDNFFEIGNALTLQDIKNSL